MGMTLTDFLLARIAEDEANYAALPFDSLNGGSVALTSADIRGIYRGESITLPGVVKSRLVAECEAKRQIVYDAQGAEDSLRSRRAPATDAINGHVIARRRVVRQLAAIYADHPDYRPEWRA